MTQFIKDQFDKHGAYVSYNGKFVARFKYQAAAKGSFITFLIKNFTVEEYFTAIDAGVAPLNVVESKGFLLPHIKKWLKQAGLPVTQSGYKSFVEQQCK